ncbi:MAG TPA: arsenate reductase ArsC [Spirochaetota bacterium]|nr:arsenate reductase ArsC [Spirochaetota bacterium]HOM38208.1 arsenate reductase ArsC [Spirochaetota bacterium]HPQ48574.1 arsenate reductase ArsC [Spirochaetota bacterium]
MDKKLKVLFVCVHNSARSQMAEKFLNELGKEYFIAESAGLKPGNLNQFAVRVMAEIGFDISEQKPKSVFEIFKLGKSYNFVITVCDEKTAEKCPLFPGVINTIHWSFEDPSTFQGSDEDKLAFTREVRDKIKEKILWFIDNYKKYYVE